jgi:NADH:ubiquinone oxidoreductase subunit D
MRCCIFDGTLCESVRIPSPRRSNLNISDDAMAAARGVQGPCARVSGANLNLARCGWYAGTRTCRFSVLAT